jgi:predicted AAA+ superfamily ATPase
MTLKRYNYNYFNKLLESPSFHPVILLEGARQVGKTTFVKQVLEGKKNVLSFNLEQDKEFLDKIDQTNNFREFEEALSLHHFDRTKKQILYIDEAQESDKLGSYVRFIKEEFVNTKCILTGSSMTRLFRNTQRVPVGRYQTLKLFPFSFYEFLQTSKNKILIETLKESLHSPKQISQTLHQALLQEVDAYLKVGGLPEVVMNYRDGLDYKSRRKSILLGQQEDFIRKSPFENKQQFMDVLKGISNHLGFTSKYTHMSEQTREIKKVASVMISWHLIHEIEQKGFSSTTQFYPKRYCYDIGIADLVRSMPFPQLSIMQTLDTGLRTQLGGLFENMALLALLEHKLGQTDISSWKESSKSNVEVDFVIIDDTPIPIECKATKKISPRVFTSLRRYLQKSRTRVGFLVSAAPFEIQQDSQYTLINLPLYFCNQEIICNLNKKHS